MLNQWNAAETVGLISPALLPWCQHQGSLTEKFQQYSDGEFSVQLVRSQLSAVQPDEAMALAIDPEQVVWLREVLLKCAGQPVAYARSVVPQNAAQFVQTLQGLGVQSLGSLLFVDGSVKRKSFQCAVLTKAAETLQGASSEHLAGAQRWYARRAHYQFAQDEEQQLLLTEVFMPEFTAHITAEFSA